MQSGKGVRLRSGRKAKIQDIRYNSRYLVDSEIRDSRATWDHLVGVLGDSDHPDAMRSTLANRKGSFAQPRIQSPRAEGALQREPGADQNPRRIR